MKLDIAKTRLQTVIKIVLFVAAAFLIFQSFPRYSSFKYQYEVGKPWYYERVTAPLDFPIYKDKSTLQAEQEEALKSFIPYFVFDYESVRKNRAALLANPTIPEQFKQSVVEKLDEVYRRGIISATDLDSLGKKGYKEIRLLDSANISKKVPVSNFFTVKTAYAHIVGSQPSEFLENGLQGIGINSFLSENIIYNKEISDKKRATLLEEISPTSGMVQANERIVDKGDIVTKRTEQLLHSLSRELEKEKTTVSQQNLMLLGEGIITAALMLILFLYLYLFRQNIYQNIKHLIFILLMMVLLVLVSSVLLKLQSSAYNIYLVPFAILPVMIRTFFDSRTALFVHIITVLSVATMLPNAFEFSLLQISAGMVSNSSLKDLTQRSQLVTTSIFVFLTCSIIYAAYCLLISGSPTEIKWINFAYLGISSLFLLFAYVLIYICERTFGFLSNVSLVELSNVNSTLLQAYSEVAPGSFQHSMQVANLASEAAKQINGNALLVRVGAIYHDIGKMYNPTYFTENQLTGINPLEKMKLEEAAQAIIRHVAEGIKIAQKNNIPEKIIDFIRSHHGDGRAWYFYNTFRNRYPNEPVNEEAFKYNCQPPATKEQAVLMMADAVEASSRSLNEYSDKIINDLVDNIIGKQIADGLLKNAKITFADVEKVKALFKEKLKTIYHTRVVYPELTKK